MTAIKCDTCGKFRKASEVVTYEHDEHGKLSPEYETQCKACLSQSDRERYFPKDLLERNDETT